MTTHPSLAEWDARPVEAFAAFVVTPDFVLAQDSDEIADRTDANRTPGAFRS